MSKEMGIVGLVLLVALGVAVLLYGNARFSEGEKSCQADQASAVADKTTEATEVLKDEQQKAENVKTDDLDAVGSSLGILRRSDDY